MPRTPAELDHQIVSISVDLGITTPDRLRHIAFGLEKDRGGDDTISWTIDFRLQERASTTDEFTDVVTLVVKVKSKNNAAAEATAKEGLSDAQANHLLGPASIAAKRLSEGNATEDQVSPVVERTLLKHNA